MPTFAASRLLIGCFRYSVCTESIVALMGNVLPPVSIVDNASVNVPGVRRLGAGFTATTLPFTVEPASITTLPEASRTSVATLAVKVSPGLFLRELHLSLTVMSMFLAARTVNDTGRLDGARAGRS